MGARLRLVEEEKIDHACGGLTFQFLQSAATGRDGRGIWAAPQRVPWPAPGESFWRSFTESQAKGRLEENGYSNVGKLTKDDNGVWKGPATHAGTQVTVSVDYRGNITRN